MKANRAFLVRAVRSMAESGIRQFLDLGAGLPTQENVHQVAQAVNPEARVAYVDNDPVALAHAKALLATDARTAAIDADLRHPGQVLDNPGVRDVIDFEEPVGVLFVAILHFVTDDQDPGRIVRAFRDAVPSGSRLAISHGNSDGAAPEVVAELEEIYRNATSPLRLRTRPEMEAFFDGWELLEPGIVDVPDWRPVSAEEARAQRADAPVVGLAGLARKP